VLHGRRAAGEGKTAARRHVDHVDQTCGYGGAQVKKEVEKKVKKGGRRASAAAATRGGGHPQQVDVTARGEQG
jgi:hypothetical protein